MNQFAANYKADLGRTAPTVDTAFVGKLLSEVFGVESPIYLPTWWRKRDYNAKPYPNVSVEQQTQPIDGYMGINVLETEDYGEAPVRYGQKVFGAFWFKGGTYLKYDLNGTLKGHKCSDFLMPLATIVDFSRPKTVKKTPTIGGMGSVKEVYAMDDWSVSIKGIIIPDQDRSVEFQMNEMQRFHEIAGSVEVDGLVFARRNIVRIVTETLAFSPIQGRPNMVQYTIDAVSDEDFLLTDVL
ncbi:MAG: hypothetical protein JW783_00335 [Bacteroidales bacterium]|nr:hypothetical protein [Bacteroidales bacterium]MBN2748468.1 hypothetical protein [Bacteroidales bacterium]